MSASSRTSVRIGVVVGMVAAMFASLVWMPPTAGAVPPGEPPDGFVLLGADGGVFTFGVAMAGAPASDPTRCVANIADRNEPNGSCFSVAVTPSGMGYWVLDGDTGSVYAYGTAVNHGEPADEFVGVGREFVPNFRQIVPTPTGRGYWIYEVGASDGGTIEHFGDAAFFGDTANLQVQNGTGFNGSAVGMARTADGKGYWEVRSDGGVFTFGDAKFYGSLGGLHLTRPIIGITPTATGKGYWLYAGDGGVFAFGDAVFGGSAAGLRLNAPIVGMARNPAGPGYWLAAADGGVFAFGGVRWTTSLLNYPATLASPIVAIAAR